MALDLLGFVLPFLLVLAIVYGALDLSGLFRKNAVNLLISLVIAFLAMSNTSVAATVAAIMPWAALLFIAVFFIKFLLSIFKSKGERDYTLLIIVLGLVVIFMLGQGTQLVQDWMPPGFPVTEENFLLIIGVVIIIAIFYAAYRMKSK